MLRALSFAGAAVSVTAGLIFTAPDGWVARTPTSSMRVAEYALPRASGDTEDAALAVFYFGGQGGSVQANLDRWMGQMAQPDGRDSRDAARTTQTKTASGLPVTLLDVSGTFVAETMPGSVEHYNKPGFRLRAAVIETADGPYFVKLTGPAATVARWDASFLAFVKSARAAAPTPR
jgi:hypothetical protein